MEAQRPWYEIDNVAGIDSPALAVYPDRVRENIRALIGQVTDVRRLRPHAKTHKSADAARMLIEEGIRKFKCATIAEAEMLAIAGAADVLIAYQPVGPNVHRILELVKRYPATDFSSVIDDPDAAGFISSVFDAHSRVLPVYIDLNVGMNRTGIDPARAESLFDACLQMKGIRVMGLHIYDGHIQQADIGERRRAYDHAFAAVDRLYHQLSDGGTRSLVMIAGGSPTFPFFAERSDVECSPGTFIFWDQSYAALLPDQPFHAAMLLLTRVISRPATGLLCLDAGYKAVACEKDLHHRLFFLSVPDAVVVSQSEEHVVIATDRADAFGVGDVFYAVPYHICPTCAMYERAVVVHGHHAQGEWTIGARNRKITI